MLVIPCIVARQLTTLNQQNAQFFFLDSDITTLKFPACFNPHGVIIREQASNMNA
jgi:hypothetical protein